MTRDFNKQPRDDARPSFRNKPSNKFGEERSSRPARPRLNRETVDRAWESGAQTQHHDYRPRTPNGQSPRNSQRNSRYSEYSSNTHANGDRSYDNRSSRNQSEGHRAPYGNRSEGNRPEGRSYEGGRPYRNRSEDGRPNGNRYEGNRSEGGRPSYGNRYEGNRSEGGRPSYGNRYEGNRSSYGNRHEDERPSYGNRYEGNRSEGGRPSYGNRYEGNRSEGGRPSYGNRREYDQESNHGARSYGHQREANYRANDRPDSQPREKRSNFGGNERNPSPRFTNERDQEREFRRDEPRTFREGRRDASQDEPRQTTSRGRYEGDYEGLDEKKPPLTPYFRNGKSRRDDEEQAQEPHVTRMPDGRVLKGPRPVQRKNEQFWKGITDDTEDLVSHVHVQDNQDETEAEEQLLTTLEHLADETPQTAAALKDDTDEEEEAGALDEPVAATPPPTRKPHTRSAVNRESKKPAAEKKPRATALKPSQRGFKWPTP